MAASKPVKMLSSGGGLGSSLVPVVTVAACPHPRWSHARIGGALHLIECTPSHSCPLLSYQPDCCLPESPEYQSHWSQPVPGLLWPAWRQCLLLVAWWISTIPLCWWAFGGLPKISIGWYLHVCRKPLGLCMMVYFNYVGNTTVLYIEVYTQVCWKPMRLYIYMIYRMVYTTSVWNIAP